MAVMIYCINCWKEGQFGLVLTVFRQPCSESYIVLCDHCVVDYNKGNKCVQINDCLVSAIRVHSAFTLLLGQSFEFLF